MLEDFLNNVLNKKVCILTTVKVFGLAFLVRQQPLTSKYFQVHYLAIAT